MFATVRVSSWEEARVVQNELFGWRFRGHQDAAWHLSSRLERHAQLFGCDLGILANRERWILREFRRRAHHYLAALPSEINLIEWLALIQHHGGPTRLLDFSHSFYIAAFFAMENATQDAAVWAIDYFKLMSRLMELTEGSGTEYIHDTHRRHEAIAATILNGDSQDRLVLGIEPEIMNERLSIQQGSFLFPCDITTSFEQNLADTLGVPLSIFDQERIVSSNQLRPEIVSGAAIVKVVLPQTMHTPALLDLKSMNISATTLFPGLDGFARSLALYLRPISVE